MKYIILEHHPADSRLRIVDEDICQTLSSRMGTGGGNVPLILQTFTTAFRKTAHPMSSEEGQGWEQTEICDTLNAFDNGEMRTPTVIVGCWTIDEKMGQTYIHREQANTLAQRDYKQPQAVIYEGGEHEHSSEKTDTT